MQKSSLTELLRIFDDKNLGCKNFHKYYSSRIIAGDSHFQPSSDLAIFAKITQSQKWKHKSRNWLISNNEREATSYLAGN